MQVKSHAQQLDFNVLTQLFFANLQKDDAFELLGNQIVVVKILPNKTIRLNINSKVKSVWFMHGQFAGHKGRKYDWFDNYFRAAEGMIVVDSLNLNNPFHEPTIFTKIAHRNI